MANIIYHKRKRHHTRSHKIRRRKRKISGIDVSSSSLLMKYGPIIVGYFMGDTINGMVNKVTGGKIDNKIVSGGELVAGALLTFGKGKKSLIKTLAGGLLLGSGVKGSLKAFNVISGYGNVPVIGGYGNVPVIGGYEAPGTLAGYIPNATLSGGKKTKVMGGIDDVDNMGIFD